MVEASEFSTTEELSQGRDILALCIRVFYSPAKKDAGYSLQGKTFHLSRNEHEYSFFGRGAIAHTAGEDYTGPSIACVDDLVSILHASESTDQ